MICDTKTTKTIEIDWVNMRIITNFENNVESWSNFLVSKCKKQLNVEKNYIIFESQRTKNKNWTSTILTDRFYFAQTQRLTCYNELSKWSIDNLLKKKNTYYGFTVGTL